jgi:hypothetical protein
MFFLFSGEGSTDLGLCAGNSEMCVGIDYLHGPMTFFVEHLVKAKHPDSPLKWGRVGFASKSALVTRAIQMKTPRSLALPGKKRRKETMFFYNNARALAQIAIDKEQELNDSVVAILFRDSDGTASAGRGLWPEKRESMTRGFLIEGFHRGVAMVPKPKSEAWILCAVKKEYRHCNALEERSGNDRSPSSLKAELESHLGQSVTRDLLCRMITDGLIDCVRINMPSFSVFKDELERAIESTVHLKQHDRMG